MHKWYFLLFVGYVSFDHAIYQECIHTKSEKEKKKTGCVNKVKTKVLKILKVHKIKVVKNLQ